METVLQSFMLRKSNPAMWFRCVSLSNCSEIMTNDRGALEGQGLSDHTNSWTPKFTLQIRWVWIVYFRMACEILLFYSQYQYVFVALDHFWPKGNELACEPVQHTLLQYETIVN